jgi:hypothetical protein
MFETFSSFIQFRSIASGSTANLPILLTAELSTPPSIIKFKLGMSTGPAQPKKVAAFFFLCHFLQNLNLGE